MKVDNACCPITFGHLAQAVMTADGHTFSREGIVAYYSRNEIPARSPITNALLPSNDLLPCHFARSFTRNASSYQPKNREVVVAEDVWDTIDRTINAKPNSEKHALYDHELTLLTLASRHLRRREPRILSVQALGKRLIIHVPHSRRAELEAALQLFASPSAAGEISYVAPPSSEVLYHEAMHGLCVLSVGILGYALCQMHHEISLGCSGTFSRSYLFTGVFLGLIGFASAAATASNHRQQSLSVAELITKTKWLTIVGSSALALTMSLHHTLHEELGTGDSQRCDKIILENQWVGRVGNLSTCGALVTGVCCGLLYNLYQNH